MPAIPTIEIHDEVEVSNQKPNCNENCGCVLCEVSDLQGNLQSKAEVLNACGITKGIAKSIENYLEEDIKVNVVRSVYKPRDEFLKFSEFMHQNEKGKKAIYNTLTRIVVGQDEKIATLGMLNGQLAGASAAHAVAVKSMGSHIDQLMADNDYLRKKLFEENPEIDAAVVAEIESRGRGDQQNADGD